MKSKDQGESQWSIAAYLVRERRLGWAMVLGGVAWALLFLIGIRIPCPVLELTGHPCPGCGLTRATFAMMRGDLKGMIHFHPFAPVFCLFWVAVVAGLLVPSGWRGIYGRKLARFEEVVRWPAWVGSALLLYSLTRWLGFC